MTALADYLVLLLLEILLLELIAAAWLLVLILQKLSERRKP